MCMGVEAPSWRNVTVGRFVAVILLVLDLLKVGELPKGELCTWNLAHQAYLKVDTCSKKESFD